MKASSISTLQLLPTMIWSIDQQLLKDGATPGDGISVEEPLNLELGAYWATPVQSSDCAEYGTREWLARLWDIPSGYDWIKACQESPVTINGVRYDRRVLGKYFLAHNDSLPSFSPDECVDLGFSGGVIGKWFISEVHDDHCTPHWRSLGNDGCTAFGKRRWWARIWDIASGVDWFKMCATTPVKINGKTYDHPTACENQQFWGGEIGIWEVDDNSCKGRWGDLKDNGCADTICRREWSSKLFDIAGSWVDACNSRDAVVGDEYCEKPTKCEKHSTGIWGVFEVQDTTCRVPPCSDRKSWNYRTGTCSDCSDNALLRSSPAIPGPAVLSSTNFTPPRHLNTLVKPIKQCLPFYPPRGSIQLYPRNSAAWQGEFEGPSADEIVAAPEARAAFQEAWDASFQTRGYAQEMGGWIYASLTNTGRLHVVIRYAPPNRSSSMSQSRPPPNVAAGIDLWNPDRAPGNRPLAGHVLVATFHTHPMGAAYGGDASLPSRADHYNAWERGVPGIIINRQGLYPNTTEVWNGQAAEGAQLGGPWRPTRAPNQED
ncbi:hypothetical protein C8J57DRAFT_1523255 [Mycena rebaudengoi]|nr:hypothetical protein C8J57DRAFT_1523255 [Mycena rebaudengoi]